MKLGRSKLLIWRSSNHYPSPSSSSFLKAYFPGAANISLTTFPVIASKLCQHCSISTWSLSLVAVQSQPRYLVWNRFNAGNTRYISRSLLRFELIVTQHQDDQPMRQSAWKFKQLAQLKPYDILWLTHLLYSLRELPPGSSKVRIPLQLLNSIIVHSLPFHCVCYCKFLGLSLANHASSLSHTTRTTNH
jgi:hypothetical protein